MLQYNPTRIHYSHRIFTLKFILGSDDCRSTYTKHCVITFSHFHIVFGHHELLCSARKINTSIVALFNPQST